jgi:hypothetical protein
LKCDHKELPYFVSSQCGFREEAPNLQTENVVMGCLIRTVIHVRRQVWSNGGMMNNRGKPLMI